MLLRIGLFGGLLGWDDVEYMESARALRDGDFSTGSFFRLRYGLTVPLAAVQALFGLSEYAAALVPLCFSLGAFFLTYALGVLYGGPILGLAATALLAVVPLDVIAATDLHADLPVSVFMAAAFYSVKRGEVGGRWERLWFAGGGVALGLAHLTKEVALAMGVVLVIRLLWLRRWWPGYGWLVAAWAVVICADTLWLWWITGIPWYRYSDAATSPHVVLMMSAPLSYEWMASYPHMLMNPLGGGFGYFSGLAYLALAGSLWGLCRRDQAVQELLIWWAALLIMFNFAPLDATFTRPLFHHFPRTLQPLLIPLVLTAALWLLRGLEGRSVLRGGAMLLVGALAVVGMWSAHFDHRLWASAARQAALTIAVQPFDVRVVADPVNAGLLRILLPDRRERIVTYADAALAAPGVPTLALRDPLFWESAVHLGHPVPKVLVSPPPNWEKVAEFARPQRPSLRGMLLGKIGKGGRDAEPIPRGTTIEPAVLWRVPSLPRQGA
jgi:4-amino-4-deoxy-L-arabinose transferase-like glycosyltransferase